MDHVRMSRMNLREEFGVGNRVETIPANECRSMVG
jgi:hypothetical protein